MEKPFVRKTTNFVFHVLLLNSLPRWPPETRTGGQRRTDRGAEGHRPGGRGAQTRVIRGRSADGKRQAGWRRLGSERSRSSGVRTEVPGVPGGGGTSQKTPREAAGVSWGSQGQVTEVWGLCPLLRHSQTCDFTSDPGTRSTFYSTAATLGGRLGGGRSPEGLSHDPKPGLLGPAPPRFSEEGSRAGGGVSDRSHLHGKV